MPRRKKTIVEDDSYLPMKQRIMRRLEKLIGYEFNPMDRYFMDRIYETLDICEEIDGSIEETERGDILYLEMTCNNKVYNVLLPLNYVIADFGEIDEMEEMNLIEEDEEET